ncbi:MAG: hypothetical protein AAF787_15290 [Chloroflexota bacterium]
MTEQDEQPSHPDYAIEVWPDGLIHFQFYRISDASVQAWYVLHRDMYAAPDQHHMVCMLIDLPSEDLMPFASITQRTKAYLNSGAPSLPTRHAFVTDAHMPTDLIQGMVRSLPSIDLLSMFYPSTGREDAITWLYAEAEEIMAQVTDTSPTHN